MKDKKDLRIVFMGTPEFAVASLEKLLDRGYHVVAVVTMPDKPQGRGMKLKASAVKQFALERGLEVLQPEKLKDSAFLERLSAFQPDLGVVVAFRMLPEVVWAMPTYGTINLHGSLLPAYRGAAPINWAIIDGMAETGVTTFSLEREIDTGDVLMQRKMPIAPDDTAGDIHDRMMYLGAETLADTVELFLNGKPKGIAQKDMIVAPTPAPKLTNENTEISFSRKASAVHNFVRGLSPFPSAWCRLSLLGSGEQRVKIFRTQLASSEVLMELPPLAVGETYRYKKNRLFVGCEDQPLEILELQLEGKKRMPSSSLLNGLKG